MAAHAVGEKPLCAAHFVGIVGWLLAFMPERSCSAAGIRGSLSHRSRKSCPHSCLLLLCSNISQ